MIRTTGTIRRASATLALAGAATFGAVALAPAASAAQPVVDGSDDYLVDGKGDGGPVAFLVTRTGRKPIFFCEADKPDKRENTCQPDPETASERF